MDILSKNEAGSPRSPIDRTFQSSFQLQTVNQKPAKKPKPAPPARRNPVNQALEWQKLIGTPGCKNKAELARMLHVSRARVSQVLNVLKLDTAVINMIAGLGDPLPLHAISEHQLRRIVGLDGSLQMADVSISIRRVARPESARGCS